MLLTKLILLISLLTIFYSYIGYGILLWLLIKVRNIFQKTFHPKNRDFKYYPVSLIIAALNEEKIISEKIENSLSLDYPKELLQIIIICDGSTDSTFEIASSYNDLLVLHQAKREGKIAAIHRAIKFAKNPIIIFSDANTLLNNSSIKKIVRHYDSPIVGGVAGEKKLSTPSSNSTVGSGESLYWKYESLLKKLDSDFYTVVGAAGELFSIRKELYEYPGDNILLDDFIISLKICQRGFRVLYEPEAYAIEDPSLSLKEEKKRKIRISAGGFQSIIVMRSLLNIFKYPKLSFQYISHRVLRWTICPLLLPFVFITNLILALKAEDYFYKILLACQISFYSLAIIGWVLSKLKSNYKLFYGPYYFVFINISLYQGFYRFLKGNQTVLWEKAERS